MNYTLFKGQNYSFIFLFFLCFIFIHWYQSGNSPTAIRQLTEDIGRANQLWDSLPQESINIIAITCKKAQELRQDTLVADIYHNIGRFEHDKTRDFHKALIAFEKGYAIREENLDSLHKDVIRSLIMVGTVHRSLQRFQSAKTFLEKALVRYELNPKVGNFRPIITLNLGSVYRALGETEKAIALFTTNRQYIIDTSAATDDKARFFNSFGLCYYQKRNYATAIEHFQNGLSIAEQLTSAQKWKLKAELYTNSSICHRYNGDFRNAIIAINSAMYAHDSIVQKDKEDFRKIANTYLERGHCYKAQNNIREAERDYKQAINILQQHQFGYSPYLSEAYTALGDIATQRNDLETALVQYHLAVGVLVTEFAAVKPQSTPVVSLPIFAPIESILALEAKAKTLFALRKASQYFQAARTTYQLLDSIVMNLKDNYRDDGSKFDLISRSVSIYEKAYSLALQAHDTTSALRYADRTKALILREGLRDRSAKQFASIPNVILEKEQNLELDIAYWHKQIASAQTDVERTRCTDSLYNAKHRFESFADTELRNTPHYQQYFNFKYSPTPPLSISNIRNSLKDSMAIIEYFMGNDSLYTITISPQQAVFGAYPLPSGFQDSFKLFRESFITDDAITLESRKQNFERLSPKFYNWLLAEPLSKIEAATHIRRLRIIPDGFLGYLPFSILLERENVSWTGNESQQPPFLVQRYAISYDYSRELMFDSTRYQFLKQNSDKKGSFGGFGISYDDMTLFFMKNANKTLLPLPKSPLEVKNIATQIGGDYFTDDANWRGQKHLSKADFIKRMKDYSLLHLSMHASVDDRNPLNSALIFSKKDSLDDNFLTAGELYAHYFNHNELTVLSACNTASGTLHRGEGIMSVARAMSFAGCKSLLATLWSVGDNDMYLIMPDFYTHLQRGLDKDFALQKAQQVYLAQNFKDPNHWAAPILIGNIDAVILQKTDWKAWETGLTLLIGLILVYFFYKWLRKKVSL